MVTVDRDACIGCGLCASMCEDVFEMDDDFKAIVKSQKDSSCVKETIESCPVDAIKK
jgi:ferredoxin